MGNKNALRSSQMWLFRSAMSESTMPNEFGPTGTTSKLK